MTERARRDERDAASSDVADRRRADRSAFHGQVTVRFEGLEIVGPGRNISGTGVYFVAEASARVRVLVDGVVRDAELIRFETLGNGKLGVAVRFLDESPAG